MAVPAKSVDDWSDSEEEDERSDIETSVLLGIPDGEIEKQEDISDAAVSRIGGHPAFLTSSEPSLSSSQCKNCSYPMELLVQLWCPFENSPMDRALYVFGCARGECQYKPGSVRAFRGLRYNTSYATKLEKKLAKQREREASRLKAKEEEEKRKASAKVNPFSMNAGSHSSGGGLFGGPSAFGSGIGSQLFGVSQHPNGGGENDGDEDETPLPPESESESEDDNPESDSESEKSTLAAPAHTPSSSSPWLAGPAYSPPLYLSTVSEYVPPAPRPKVPSSSATAAETVAGLELWGEGMEGGKSKKAEARRAEKEVEEAKAWNAAMEGYEDSLEVDKVFEKFARVAGYEGEQCLRYELGGTPLPYSNNSIFKALFPSPSSTFSTSTSIPSSQKFTPATTTSLTPARRTYDAKSSIISPCPRCGGPRTFECQLMPHLISLLQSQRQNQKDTNQQNHHNHQTQTQTQNQNKDPEERKKELESLLSRDGGKGGGDGGAGGGPEKRGMEWGTCMVFSCARDCRVEVEAKNNERKEKGRRKGEAEAKELWAEELVLVQWDE